MDRPRTNEQLEALSESWPYFLGETEAAMQRIGLGLRYRPKLNARKKRPLQDFPHWTFAGEGDLNAGDL
jgi:hypothetical protein